MKINSLYRDYIQKSKVFLYPMLNINRGGSVTPIQTFMSWEDKYSFADSKFIIQYHLRNDADFKLFETVKLLSNPFFHEFYELESDDGLKTGAYVFDFSDRHDKEFWKIVTGKYSQLTPNTKAKVLEFFKSQSSHHAYIESYLYPKKYYPMYSEILGVDIEHLKFAGELCSIPDLEKETLTLKIKSLNFESKPLILPE